MTGGNSERNELRLEHVTNEFGKASSHSLGWRTVTPDSIFSNSTPNFLVCFKRHSLSLIVVELRAVAAAGYLSSKIDFSFSLF